MAYGLTKAIKMSRTIEGLKKGTWMFSLFDIGLPGVTKKIGAAPRGLPLTLRNYK